MAAAVLYCWKELDWGGGRTDHAHPNGSVFHGGSWPPPPRMRRFVKESLLYALVTHRSRASTAQQTDQVSRLRRCGVCREKLDEFMVSIGCRPPPPCSS